MRCAQRRLRRNQVGEQRASEPTRGKETKRGGRQTDKAGERQAEKEMTDYLLSDYLLTDYLLRFLAFQILFSILLGWCVSACERFRYYQTREFRKLAELRLLELSDLDTFFCCWFFLLSFLLVSRFFLFKFFRVVCFSLSEFQILPNLGRSNLSN